MSDERDEVESTHSFLELNLAHDSQEEDGNAGGDRNAESNRASRSGKPSNDHQFNSSKLGNFGTPIRTQLNARFGTGANISSPSTRRSGSEFRMAPQYPTFRPDVPPPMGPSSFSQPSYMQSEVFLAALAAANTAMKEQEQRNKRRSFHDMGHLANNTYTCPKCTYSSSNDQQMSSHIASPHGAPRMRQFLPYDNSNRRHSGVPDLGLLVQSAFSPPMQQPLPQKVRKPYFMPYITGDIASRGLKNGSFIKGTLRVNKRNFEEAFIDNPDGDDQQDIMILGVHDRNRALDGDMVVLKIKERSEWIIRDAMYMAWRSGQLNMACDEDGQPISVPPVPNSEKEHNFEVLQFLPDTYDKLLVLYKINQPISMPKNKRYPKEVMLKLGVEVAVSLKNYANDEKKPSYLLQEDLMKRIRNLSIEKDYVRSTAAPPITPRRASGALDGMRRNSPAEVEPQRRLNYRILSEMPIEDWGIPDVCLQKTAMVVYIAEQKNSRIAVGQLKVMADGNRKWALFSPNDSRMPRMMIPSEQLPDGFYERPQDYAKYIFVASIVDWPETAQFARGKLYKHLGMVGDIEAETEGLLIANSVDTREFSRAALDSLPFTDANEWEIDQKEYKYRKDFRNQTVFTIDPKTARDLDDALHVERISDCDGKGTPGWEVGVHIADVSYFLDMNTELDIWAACRANSVYLVHKVVPMLPRILSEELCSLNPGRDRLTFSVVWKMNDDADIMDEWFGRSIIHSCSKLFYEHAQEIITHPEKDAKDLELPELFNEKTADKVKESVSNLFELSQLLKKKRVEGGSLRLDQPKLKFALDQETGMPYGVSLDKREEANHLVEEFMLLANIAVAKKISAAFPKIALLRRHGAPKSRTLREVARKCTQLSFPISVDSSKDLASSLFKYASDPTLKDTVHPVLVHMLMKSMVLAKYFCTGKVQSESDYHHFALSVDRYTHFTSPIRRYPDVVVHRLLAAALGYIPPPGYTIKQIAAIAERSNDRKMTAKAIYEANSEMFFGLLINRIGSVEALGVVVGILDLAFDVLLVKYGIIRRVYMNRLKLAREPRFVEGFPGALILRWDPAVFDDKKKQGDNGSNAIQPDQTIRVLSIVRVILTSTADPSKFSAVIMPSPDDQPLTFEDVMTYMESECDLDKNVA
ncbi:RNB domain-containing protein [Ditylenchus destructor]|uniref:RNB domain-containing protein n=1 Tax=Ditylenchus destructor TaxID=166010 RepID=A0AAD4R5P4_9BILA|nr:RNB domain-containing protein [Ditylenchus destructor]